MSKILSRKLSYARAGLEGRAGFGADASFSGAYDEGMLSFTSKMGGAIGLGGGVKTSLGINPIDGGRLGDVMGMRGVTLISDTLSSAADWMDTVLDEVQKEIDDYMEEEKTQGDFMGWVMGGVDYVGDKLLNL